MPDAALDPQPRWSIAGGIAFLRRLDESNFTPFGRGLSWIDEYPFDK